MNLLETGFQSFNMWSSNVCCLLFCLVSLAFHQTYAVDHASRLDDIIARKTKESHTANTHANNLLKNAKVRLEDSLAAAKKKIPELSNDARKVHDSHTGAITEKKVTSGEQTVSRSEDRKVAGALREHGVSDSLVREINNMASSYIPRETIVKHVQSHFPNKEQHEWNDIVISAISAKGKEQPDSLATTKSSKAQANFQQQQFQKAKDSLEFFQD